MAEKAEEEGWVTRLKQYNTRLSKDLSSKSPLDEGGDTEEDRKLLEEYYVTLKGESGRKYSVLPKFYSKVIELVMAVAIFSLYLSSKALDHNSGFVSVKFIFPLL